MSLVGETEGLDDRLVEALLRLAGEVPFTIRVTSGLRPEDYGSEHCHGLAADIAVEGGGWHRRMLVEAALPLFDRVGVYDRHVHVGIDLTRPAPVLWVGKSR